MLVEISTNLNCSAAKTWEQVLTSRLLNYVAYPLVTFKALPPKNLPAVWQEEKYLVGMRIFGLIPFGKQWINITFPTTDSTAGRQIYQIRDNGSGDFIKKWDH